MPRGSDVRAFMEELKANSPALRAEIERRAPRYAAIDEVIRARKDAHLTQKQLADLMGVSQAVVSRLEGAEHSPRIDTLAAAARAMGYDLEVRLVKRTVEQRRVAEEGGEYEVSTEASP